MMNDIYNKQQKEEEEDHDNSSDADDDKSKTGVFLIAGKKDTLLTKEN